jgi:cyclopropane fatty-acyl-phospholipid synthase-like methyltransferase
VPDEAWHRRSNTEDMAEPNKDYWRREKTIDYDRRQDVLIPRKDELLDTIVDFIPFAPKDQLRILDVGAGQGALSERILNKFPRARVCLFDASNEMLNVAEQRLNSFSDRFSTVIGDFNTPDWPKQTHEPFDAIVSAISLHYLKTQCRALFFNTVFSALKVPGCFVNGGAFRSRNAFIQYRSDTGMMKYVQKRLRNTEGIHVPIQKLRERIKKESQIAGVNRFFLSEQSDLLEQAGFFHVEVVWRYLFMAVVVAYKE